eukprot:GILJ01023794.1.p1 GENE.GILJ01023794.1~~GILJ01023794.1.p1  ORF type:complete len:102 (-),score=0.28 GILJ01023794.1:16-321(-)
MTCVRHIRLAMCYIGLVPTRMAIVLCYSLQLLWAGTKDDCGNCDPPTCTCNALYTGLNCSTLSVPTVHKHTAVCMMSAPIVVDVSEAFLELYITAPRAVPG